MRLLMFFLLFFLGVVAFPAQAVPQWTAWLQYGRHMTLVSSAGEILREVDLPVSEGQILRDAQVAVSPSGRLAAYLASSEDKLTALQVMLYDLEANRLQWTYPLNEQDNIWGSSWFEPTEQMFNAEETRLVFGYTLVEPETLAPDWKLLVLDLADGSPRRELHHQDMLEHGLIESLIWTPLIRRYQGDAITFTLDILENEGNPHTFTWNLISGDVQPSAAFPGQGGDLFAPTGESISLMYGESPLPIPELAQQLKPVTLQVYDPLLGGRYPFHQFDEADPIYPPRITFVQNGQGLILETQRDDLQGWTLIGRDGRLVGEWSPPPNVSVISLKGSPEGFLYTSRFVSTGVTIPLLMAVDTSGAQIGVGRAIWNLSFQEYGQRAGAGDVPLEIAWVERLSTAGPFKPWAQLAEPVYGLLPGQVNLQPTSIPTPQALFQIGMSVRVQTTEGEILNLRRAASRDAEVILYLEDDMLLVLVDGPVQAEGYTWWRVRTSEGIEGWAAEYNGQIQTLVPLQ